jgi:hypothetical protein
MINNGVQERLINLTTTEAGETAVTGSVKTDSILVSLFVSNISSGTLSVTVYTFTDTGKQVDIITFPAVSSQTTELLLRKAAVTLQNFKVVATYTGVCSFEVYVRAINGAGEASAKILGSSNWSVDRVVIGTTNTELIAVSLDDRSGLLVKNWSQTSTVYVAESEAKLDAGKGYPLAPRDALALDIAAGASVWAVSTGADTDVRIAQAGG